MNVLAIGAHFDDVELGCGGTLARHVHNGDDVYVYIATVSGFTNQYNEAVRSNEIARREGEAAMRILGVKELICGNFAGRCLPVPTTRWTNTSSYRICPWKP